MDKGVIHTDDENKAKDLAKQGVQVQLHKKGEPLDTKKIKEAEGLQFDLEQTKAISKEVSQAVVNALKEDGMEIATGKIHRLEPMSFDVYVSYKDGKDDEFSFHIDQDRKIILSDFTYSEAVGEVGLKGAGEPFVNKDVLKANILKLWAKLDGNVQENTEGMDLMQQLEKALQSHDWYYMMSDDHRWYTRGSQEAQNIRNLIVKLKDAGKGDEAEALYKSYSDKHKFEQVTTEASVASIQKKHGEIVAKMKALAVKYKGGDQSVVPELKALTAEKKKLEAELDAAVAGTGKDQELDNSVNEYEHIYKLVGGECRKYNDEGDYTVVSMSYCRYNEGEKAKKDFDKDGEVESPEAEYKGVKDKAIKKATLKEDWGSSDQSAMNNSIHKDLGEPTEMPNPFSSEFESAVEEAVDFYWDEWEEYQTNREGLVDHAKKLYLRRYFPEQFANLQKMFSEGAVESYADLEKVANDTSKMPAERDAARNKMYAMKKPQAGTKLAEAPEGVAYIKVSVRDAKKALDLLDDMYRGQFTASGSDTYYFKDEQKAYDAMMDFNAHGVEVIDSNVEMDEAKHETELVQDPKTKEFTRKMKMTPKDMDTIGKVQAMMAKEKEMKKEGEEEEVAKDITGKAYSIGDIIEFRGHKFECQIGQRGIVVLQHVDDQLNPLPEFYEGGTPQFTALLKNAKIVKSHSDIDENKNPEGDQMVLRFLKGIAKKFDYPVSHAAIFVKERLKSLGY
ncbi:MAG: hypothetical protein ACO22Y_00065 [Sediminibacterium sp.]